MLNKLKKLKPRIELLPKDINKIHAAIATWFGAGLIRPAPGTIGTIAAIPVGYAISYATHPIFLLGAAALLFVIGTYSADKYGKASGKVDDSSIVVDEVVGIWIAAAPAFDNIYLWIWAFVLFRLFDIFKAWPASYFDEDSKNGFHVMMDDVVAGIYAMFGVAMFAF